jgi:hypothetical protein
MVLGSPPHAAAPKGLAMDLAHALAVGGLAARRTERRFRADHEEVLAAERRVVERLTARAAASARREFTERGRHAAPRPANA